MTNEFFFFHFFLHLRLYSLAVFTWNKIRYAITEFGMLVFFSYIPSSTVARVHTESRRTKKPKMKFENKKDKGVVWHTKHTSTKDVRINRKKKKTKNKRTTVIRTTLSLTRLIKRWKKKWENKNSKIKLSIFVSYRCSLCDLWRYVAQAWALRRWRCNPPQFPRVPNESEVPSNIRRCETYLLIDRSLSMLGPNIANHVKRIR